MCGKKLSKRACLCLVIEETPPRIVTESALRKTFRGKAVRFKFMRPRPAERGQNRDAVEN